MQGSNVGAPTAEHSGTIFIAIELSQKAWVLTIHSPDRDGISQPKLAGGDHAGLLRLISDIRERVRGKLGSLPEVVTC
jgi:transposase